MTDAADELRTALADRYAIERELGRGGAAVVYLARDLRHERLVALKVLRPDLSLLLGAERFLREIRVTAGLRHPHILPLFDSGEAGGLLWYTAPYVEGESLRARLSRDGMLPVDEAVRVASQAADALEYAHSAGVVHRDIKPGNILMLGRHAVVADFGISHLAGALSEEKLTQTGLSIGTPGYMSPEQATGGAVDRRADVYALGIVLYEMLAGEPPFGGPNSQAIIARQLTSRAPRLAAVRPNLPADLGDVVATALASEPADRYQTAAEFAAALSQATVKAAPAAPSTAPSGPRSRHVAAALGLAALALAALAGVLWMVRGREAAAPVVPTPTDPRVVAVVPFASSVPDTALERLGRDLVFTLSAALDGVGDLRTADAHSILAQAASGAGLHSITEALALARRLGAGRLLTGSLVREGAAVRIDGVLYQVGDSADRVRASFTAAPDSVATLTDSLAQRVLPALLRRGTIQETSLESALRTSSVPALRAFLEGEQLLAASRWSDAAAAYRRALAADSTFWLAASRLAFALDWTLEPVPEALLRELGRNAPRLPRRERLELAGRFAAHDSGLDVAVERFRELVSAYPTSWFGWFAYGDLLLHDGPLIGQPLSAARPMFARTLELNPALVPAWDHDLMLAAAAGDAARIRQGLAALDRVNARPADEYGNTVLSFRLLRALIERDSAGAGSALDSVAADKVAAGRAASSFYEPLLFGFPGTQIALVRAVLARGGGAVAGPAYRDIEAYSLAAEGAWDSAIATMPVAGKAHGLAVLAAAGGERGWDRADSLPGAGPRAVDRLFLDGVTAFGRGNREGLEAIMRRLTARRDSSAAFAARALGFYAMALGGDSARAGAGLAELEWGLANRRYDEVVAVPYLPALDRLYAARWLDAAGDTAQARRLRLVAESRFSPHPAAESFVVLDAMLKRAAPSAPAP
jgi:hypothetical protein